MARKKKSLSRKSILMLAVLGLILFIGIGLAGGIQLYRQNLETAETTARSNANILSFEISDSDVGAIVTHEQEIRDLIDKTYEYEEEKKGTLDEAQILAALRGEFDNDVLAMNLYWNEIDGFIVALGNINKDIQYAYVVVPEENELAYIWDSDLDREDETRPIFRKPYNENEKEHIAAVMQGDKGSDFFTETVDGELLGTALAPIYYNGKVCAVAAADVSVSRINRKTITLLLHIGLAILLVMLVTITIYHYVFQKQILSPIKAISNSMIRFAKDSSKKPEPLNIKSNDEIGEIADSYEKMTGEISTYVRNIEDLTRERVQTNVELTVARRIQNGLVPEQYMLEGEGYRVHALTRPARAVGGDFYDCFPVDDNSICVFMGDVSGKGVSAAIFMAMAKTIIREKLLAGLGPAEALDRTNSELCEQNPEYLFVTAFAAILNTQTGEIRYANAGHTLPVMLKKEPAYLEPDSGIALGVIKDAAFSEASLFLHGGEGILLYTDGVTEAANPQNEFFGTDGLLSTIRTMPTGEDAEDDASAQAKQVQGGANEDVLAWISRAVDQFTEGCEPFDDMAVLALYRTGGDILELSADPSSFATIRRIVLGAVPDTLEADKVLLVCDEVFSNIVTYSGAKKLAFSLKKLERELQVCFADDGIPFDPTAEREEGEAPREPERGGMGLTIVRESVTSMRYEREDGRNRLFLFFTSEAGAD